MTCRYQFKSVESVLYVKCCCAKRLKALLVSTAVVFSTLCFIILTPPTENDEIVYIRNGRFRRVVFQEPGSGSLFEPPLFLLGNISKTLTKTTVKTKDSVSKKSAKNYHNENPSKRSKISENKRTYLLDKINASSVPLNISAFGSSYVPAKTRSTLFDFPFLINGSDVCRNNSEPFLVIMVLSVHTHIDTRTAIRKTWGRAANPGLWPKVGALKHAVKLVFLFGNSKSELGQKIIKEESKIYGDIVHADFIDSYFNLTYKTVMGIRWVAEFCSKAHYILKADEDVFVHVHNLLQFLSKRENTKTGVIYGHSLQNSDVFREGRWAVSKKAYPLNVYPAYTCGNTYVISGKMAANIYYTAGLLPYLNIEDVFVTGIIRMFLNADLVDVVGFTHWFEKKPKPCEFKNSVRISATKVADFMQYDIWEGLKTKEADCYKIIRTKHVKTNRPERGPRMTQMIRDEHIYMNKSSGQFYTM